MTYPAEVLADSPLVYWRLGEASGTSAADDSGNGLTGTYNGAVALGETGLVGDADTAVRLHHAGDDQFIQSNADLGHTIYAAWTLECLVKIDAGHESESMAFVGIYDATFDHAFEIYLNSGIVYGDYLSPLSYDQAGSDGTLVGGAAAHYALTYDGTTARFYRDGVEFGNVLATFNGADLTGVTAYLYAGGDGLGFDESMTGVVDEPAFYTHALSAERVAAHATAAGFSPSRPTVTAISPTHGVPGDVVTLTGTGFAAATNVKIGAVPCPSFTILSDTSATCVVPTESPGLAFVQVFTPAGFSVPVDPDNLFTVDSVGPTITIIINGSGVPGTVVTISGSRFTGVTDVTFDGISAAFTFIDDSTISATAPTGPTGFVPVVVSTPDGDSAPSTWSYETTPPVVDCIALTVGSFVADGVTPDGAGIVYTVESIDGWWDTPPMRSATAEAQPDGEFVVVNRLNARQIVVTILAHAPGGDTPLGDVGCFTAMQTVKAAFDSVYVPVLMEVADPGGADVSTLVRNAAPTRASVVGQLVAARIQVTLIAPDPTLA